VPPAAAGQAYLDAPIRIPHGQVTTQPSLIATMVAALGLTGSERVLEVGTGLGFQPAILGGKRICGCADSTMSRSQTTGPGCWSTASGREG
jgi:protein-L-isoaspartate O-methyltransferase